MEKLVQRFEHIEIDKLIPYENNARTHSAEQIEKIANSIKEFGKKCSPKHTVYGQKI